MTDNKYTDSALDIKRIQRAELKSVFVRTETLRDELVLEIRTIKTLLRIELAVVLVLSAVFVINWIVK